MVVFALSYVTFAAIKAVFGLRVTPQEEEAGLDIVEHGMYGYPGSTWTRSTSSRWACPAAESTYISVGRADLRVST